MPKIFIDVKDSQVADLIKILTNSKTSFRVVYNEVEEVVQEVKPKVGHSVKAPKHDARPTKGLQERVYDYIYEHEGCTNQDIKNSLDSIGNSVYAVTSKLYEQGLITKRIDSRTAYFSAI